MLNLRHTIATFLLLIGCTLAAETTLASAHLPSEAEYKTLSKTWTLHADGSQSYRFRMELTLFTHAAMNGKYGETFITYNPDYQTLTINESYTQQTDGTIVTTPDNAFVEVLPQNAADAPAYNHLKEMVVVHTGLELGATICLDYTLTSRPGYLNYLDVYEGILQASPVCEYTLSVVTPLKQAINSSLFHSKVKPGVRETDSQRITTWTFHHMPQMPTSDFVSLSSGDLPHLVVTTSSDVSQTLSVLKHQLDTPDMQMKTLAGTLIDSLSDQSSQIKALHAYVQKQIALSPLTLQQTGYRFRRAVDVVRTAYGTEAEKANLLCVLLQSIGIDADVVASYPIENVKGLSLQALRHLYVAIDDGAYILSVHGLSRPQDVFSRQTYLYRISDGSKFSLPSTRQHQIVGCQSIIFEDGQWLISAQDTVGSDLLPYFTAESSKRQTSMASNDYGDYTVLELHENPLGFNSLGYGRLNSTRKCSLLLPRLVDETYLYEITCPVFMQLSTLPKKIRLENTAGEMFLSIEKEGRRVIVKRRLKLKKIKYTSSEYTDLRQLLVTWNDPNLRRLLFRRVYL